MKIGLSRIRKIKYWRDIQTGLIAATAAGFILLLHIFVFQAYQVEGASMFPTLKKQRSGFDIKARPIWLKINWQAICPKKGRHYCFQIPKSSCLHRN